MYYDLWPYVLWPLDFQTQKRIVSAETIWGYNYGRWFKKAPKHPYVVVKWSLNSSSVWRLCKQKEVRCARKSSFHPNRSFRSKIKCTVSILDYFFMWNIKWNRQAKKSAQSILGHSGFRSKYTLSQNCILLDSQTLPFKYMSVIERLPPSNTLTSPPDSGNQDLNKACNLRT